MSPDDFDNDTESEKNMAQLHGIDWGIAISWVAIAAGVLIFIKECL